jgi:hypothetical protein
VQQFVIDRDNSAHQVSRRNCLRFGGLASLGSLLSSAPTARAHADNQSSAVIPGFGRAKSVIVVFASGGQSQLDTWDPKPQAPLEIRGAFQPAQTAVPGTLLCEHMPRLSKLSDRYSIIRSMSHEDLDHGSAFYLGMTGQYHIRRSSNPPPAATDLPCYGSIYKRLNPKPAFVESVVHINGPALVPALIGPGQDGGLLGRKFDPMVIGDVNAGSVAFPGLAVQPELTKRRLELRRQLVETLDHKTRRLQRNQTMADMSQLYGRAFDMLDRPETRNAFDLSAEPAKLRDRYGRNRSGQACLLARRLVEAGVPLITVMFNHTNRGQDTKPNETDSYGWDTHNDIFSSLEKHLLPRFDLGFSALLEDLEARGLLDETLVICMGEFGRAPLVAREPNFAGNLPGRKHWAAVYSIVMAGAGVSRGKLVGASDRNGAYPSTHKFGPWDVTATIFSALGIHPGGHFTDALTRPFPISEGRPIIELYEG